MIEVLLIGTLGVVGVGGFMGFTGFATYNRLMALDERCTTAFSDVDSLLKHRHNLIPGLVETVKAFAAHETHILDAVTRARTYALNAGNMQTRHQAEDQLGQQLNSLVSIAAKYPDIRASSHFNDFRNSLIEIENRITAARRFYNNTVEEHNSTLRQFPANMIGNKLRLSKRQQYSLGAERILHDEPMAIKF